MARRKRSPQELERRAKMRELLQMSNVSSMKDIQELFKETIAEFFENGLEAELDEELGYSKYDYHTTGTSFGRLQNRSVEDIFIACTDNLTGFSQAIEAVFPRTEIQNCIVHQIRNSARYVSYKDLKAVYGTVDETSPRQALEDFRSKWDTKYPTIGKSWENNWAYLSSYFKYPEAVRRLIYTTNTTLGFNRQLKKLQSRSPFFRQERVY